MINCSEKIGATMGKLLAIGASCLAVFLSTRSFGKETRREDEKKREPIFPCTMHYEENQVAWLDCRSQRIFFLKEDHSNFCRTEREQGGASVSCPDGTQALLADGLTGETGEQGEKGTQGAKGPKGDRGSKGMRGEAGPPGPRGAKGEAGIQGEKGLTGEQGMSGDIGPDGDAGEKGQQGARGPDGPQGEIGNPGPKGPQGPKGVRGERGIKGENAECQ